MHCQNMEVFRNTSVIFSDNLMNEMHPFKSNTDMTSHLELPNRETVSLNKDMPIYSLLSLYSNDENLYNSLI